MEEQPTFGMVHVGGRDFPAWTPHARNLLVRASELPRDWVDIVIEAMTENRTFRCEMERTRMPVTDFDRRMQELAKRYGG